MLSNSTSRSLCYISTSFRWIRFANLHTSTSQTSYTPIPALPTRVFDEHLRIRAHTPSPRSLCSFLLPPSPSLPRSAQASTPPSHSGHFPHGMGRRARAPRRRWRDGYGVGGKVMARLTIICCWRGRRTTEEDEHGDEWG